MAGIPVNRAMLIGLGGQGQNALVAAKTRMLDAYGEIPPIIKFLAIDSAPLDDDNGNPDNKGHLVGNEYLSISVPNAAEYIDDHREALSQWLDYEHLPRSTLLNSGKGAGQIPMIGRFLLLFHLTKILGMVQSKLNEIGDPVAMRDSTWSPGSARPRIIFFGSIAGGTGAGTLLDLACAMRPLTGGHWDYQAFLMLPGVFVGKQLTHYVEENGYAFLKQLDFFMSERNEIVAGTYGDLFDVKTQDGTEYQLAYPFNDITLIGNTSQGAQQAVYTQPKELSKVVGEVIYATTGESVPLDKKVAETLVNQGNFETAWNGGKTCLYRGIGIGVLRYPRAELMAYGECAFIAKLVDALKVGGGADGGQVADADKHADDFRTKYEIQGAGSEQSQILEAILPQRRFSAFAASIPAKISTGHVEEVWQMNASLLAGKVNEWTAEASTNMARADDEHGGLLGRVQDGLEQKANNLVSAFGAGLASSFVAKLTGYFKGVSEQTTVSNKAATADVARLETTIAGMKNSCVDATGKMFGKKETIEKVLGAYRGALMQLAKAHGEQVRTTEANRFCSSVDVALGNVGKWLSNIDELAKGLQTQAVERRQAAVGITPSKICEYLVMPDLNNLPMPEASPSDFYAWFRDTNKGSASFWSGTTDAAWSSLEAYTKGKNVSESLKNTTLASVVKDMTPEQREFLLKTAESMAEPLLAVSSAKVEGQRPENQVATLYIVAADPAFKDAFSDPKLMDRLKRPDSPDPQSIDLPDPCQAYFFRSWGCVPAYALEEFRMLRNEYLDMSAQPKKWSLHLDKRWGDVLPDLDPSSGEDADQYVWALAVSDIDYFRRVRKSVNFYTFVYEETYSSGKVVPSDINLGMGLATARSAFFSKSEYVDQCKRQIVDAIAQRGNAAALTDLAAYQDRMIEEIARADPSRKPLLDKDFKALDDFITTLKPMK